MELDIVVKQVVARSEDNPMPEVGTRWSYIGSRGLEGYVFKVVDVRGTCVFFHDGTFATLRTMVERVQSWKFLGKA